MAGKVLQLFDVLRHGEIIYAPALPFKRNGFYADMALISIEGSTKIIAEGVDLPGGEEAFFLNLVEYEADKYWPDKRGIAAWPPRRDEKQNWTAVDLVPSIKKVGLEAILENSRRVAFYRNAKTSQIGVRGLLQSSTAVSLGGSDGQLLIYATSEFPCSIEVVMEPLRIRSILSELEEFCVDRR